MASAERVQTRQLKQPRAGRKSSHRRDLTRLARISWGIAIGTLLLLLGVAAAFQLAERGQIRSGVTAFGVDLGGMTREEAIAALTAETQARAGQPLTLLDDERTWEVSQHEVGLRFDVEGAVDEAMAQGRSGFGPGRLAAVWHLKREPTPIDGGHVAVQTDATQAILTGIAAEINQPTIEPEFAIADDGSYHYVEAQVGRELDLAASQERIIQALSAGQSRVDLAINEYPPTADNLAFAQVLTQAQNVLDAPVTLNAGGETWTFEPGLISSRLIFVPPANGNPAALQIDEQWLGRLVDEISWTINRQPQSPRVWWDASGLIVTRDPQPGFQLRYDEALDLVRDVFSGTVNMDSVDLPVDTLAPPPLPEDLNSLALYDVIAESSTPYGGGIPERMHNIELAAQLLNGTLIMPGQEFSFNSEIGPMTLDAGFQIGFGIINDGGELRTIPTEAGGICQVATTVFQPVFAAGYEITQRSTHSYWIASYAYNGMVGLDATVDPASGLDFKWRNNSEHPVLLQATADGENFIVRLIGQAPGWEVEIHEPVIDNIQWADTETVHYEEDPSLEPGEQIRVERAQDGFDVEIARTVTYQDGSQSVWKDEVTYGKARNVILVGPADGGQSESADAP